jgi:hypothetical protein
MSKYSNLRFFNGTSGELNFNYDNNLELWDGIIFAPRVSVGLYETINLFILEEVYKDLGGFEYITPIAEGNSSRFKFEIEDNEDYRGDIFLYGVNSNAEFYQVYNMSSQIETVLDQSVSIGTNVYQNYNTTTGIPTQGGTYKVIGQESLGLNQALHCKIAIMSHEEKIHIKLLNIYEIDSDGNNTHLIATIKIYGETVAEDERLTSLLSNLGMSFHEEDFLIFKTSDVNELKVDFQLINAKRKELLLEAHNIKPFIGTYKAIVNAIKFFGYDNIKLKEYWLNINEQAENFGKLIAVDVPDFNKTGYLSQKNSSTELPNSNLKKTSRFSLVYRINEPDGGVDEWDTPTVKESFDFTPEEVLIKLYGLKRRLQKDYLPLQAKIVDITGEADFFTQFTQNVWNDQQLIQVQSSGTEVDFSIFPEKRLFIEDLRLVSQFIADTAETQNFNFNAIWPIVNSNIEINKVKDFYRNYYNQELNTFTTLSTLPIGCPVVLECTSLTDEWDSCEFTWNDVNLASNDYTTANSSLYNWNSLWKKDVYEAEWVVTGPNNYRYSLRKDIDNNKQILLILPNSGEYEVTLNLYDLYNTKSSLRKNNIVVYNKSVEMYGFYSFKPEKDQWNFHDLSWNLSGGYYDQPQDSYNTVDEMIGSWYLTLDRANYPHDTSNGVNFSTVSRYLDILSPTGFSETAGPFFWSNLKKQVWDDGYGITWDSTRIGSDLTASFLLKINQDTLDLNGSPIEITYLDSNGKIAVDRYSIKSEYPEDINDLSAYLNIKNELNSVDPVLHPGISRFKYNAILIDTDNDGVEDECSTILAVGKDYSSKYDFVDVKILNQQRPVNDGIIGKNKYHAYNPTYNDIILFNDSVNISLMQHVTMSYDKTNMPGIVSQEWKIINNTTGSIVYYEGQWLTYLFNEHGEYTIELKLIDCNGNINSTKRNIISVTPSIKARPKRKTNYQYS